MNFEMMKDSLCGQLDYKNLPKFRLASSRQDEARVVGLLIL